MNGNTSSLKFEKCIGMVKKKKPVRKKHIPQRTCVACREVLPKRALIRVVRTQDGIRVDPTGKLNGRGAYLHDRRECWEKGIKDSLAHALRTKLEQEDLYHLSNYANQLA